MFLGLVQSDDIKDETCLILTRASFANTRYSAVASDLERSG